MAKRFFFVCAGLLCLALAYHLGARSAQGQTPYFRVLESNLVLAGNRVWTMKADYAEGWVEVTGDRLPPVPPSTLVALSSTRAITESGEGWFWYSGSFRSAGCVPGGPSPAQQETFGGLKARYRPSTDK